MPSLEKLGFEMVVLSHNKSASPTGKIAPCLASCLFRISTGRESSCFSTYVDYAQYKAAQEEIGEPYFNDVALPLTRLTVQKFEFAPLVKKVLGLDVEL